MKDFERTAMGENMDVTPLNTRISVESTSRKTLAAIRAAVDQWYEANIAHNPDISFVDLKLNAGMVVSDYRDAKLDAEGRRIFVEIYNISARARFLLGKPAARAALRYLIARKGQPVMGIAVADATGYSSSAANSAIKNLQMEMAKNKGSWMIERTKEGWILK